MFGKKKKKSTLVCPKCRKPYRPDKTIENIFGIFPFGFKCKWCGYHGPGPVKLVEEKK